MKKNLDEILLNICNDCFAHFSLGHRTDLEVHCRDREDFFEVGIGSLESALTRAYQAAKGSKRKLTKKEQKAILDIAVKHIYVMGWRGDFEYRYACEEDFFEVGIGELVTAMTAAYELAA